jgi:hypothetical protein
MNYHQRWLVTSLFPLMKFTCNNVVLQRFFFPPPGHGVVVATVWKTLTPKNSWIGEARAVHVMIILAQMRVKNWVVQVHPTWCYSHINEVTLPSQYSLQCNSANRFCSNQGFILFPAHIKPPYFKPVFCKN